MKSRVSQQNHHNEIVWTNELMDELRRSECLCLNCQFMPIQNCIFSKKLFNLCKDFNLALAVTRCPDWQGEDGST